MPRLNEFAAFLFDLDGLVLDTEPTFFNAWHLALSEMGYQSDLALFKQMSGFRFAQIQTCLLEHFGEDFDLETFRLTGTRLWHQHVRQIGVPINPGVNELLDFAEQHSIPVAIATNSRATSAQLCLEIAGIRHRFPVIVTSDDVVNAKPAPEIFIAAAKRLGADIQRCIVFEDSPVGIIAAKMSGAFSVFVPSVYPADPAAKKLCDRHFDTLLQALQSLTEGAAIGL